MSDQLSQDLASLRIDRGGSGSSGGSAPAHKPRGSASKVIVPLVIIGALVAGGVVAAPYLTSIVFKTEVATTEVLTISPSQAAMDLTSTGYVIPQTVARVGAKVIGRLTKVTVKEGDVVKAGQVLFELDAADQESSLASARARAASARAKIEMAKASAAEIDIQLERDKKLVASGAIASAGVDDLTARSRSLHAQIASAEAETSAANAEANVLSQGMHNLSIVSPINGTVMNKPSQIGDVVGPQTSIVEIADFKTLLVETDVPEIRLGLVKIAGPTEIILDALGSKRHRGEVVDVSPRINRAKATATVKVKFIDEPSRLSPDMSARVSFLSKALDEKDLQAKPKTVVPSAAIVSRDGKKGVFLIDGSNVRFREITTGEALGNGFELLEGPAPGTRIVRDAPPTLSDGKPIKEKAPT